MIKVENITKSYGALMVLKGITLEIPEKKVVAIVGPSGAGKTTLLQIMGTLGRADSGQVLINGENVAQLNDRQLAKFRNTHIGFVFQFHHLLPEFTALENVCMPALIAGKGMATATKKSTELLKMQRVAVARALVNNPTVILADEPSGNLDSRNKEELHKLFFMLRDQLGQTFVVVTHDKDLAQMADLQVGMNDGLLCP